ncbi:MAG: hypothetical protein JWL77_5393 [Chthonomonadaceae bacterium]|nr:hypothetical protein [Chthonomonadaceae bacterium]
MPFFRDVHILPSGKTHQFSGAPSTFYWFEDGLVTPVHTALVWCRDCQDVTEGEVIETLEELDALIEEYGNPDSARYRSLKESFKWTEVSSETMRSHQESARHRRRWRVLRQSPPKCLQCGKTDILVLPWHEKVEVEGNTIYISVTTHWSGDWIDRYLNTEGEWLPEPDAEENECHTKKWWQFWR